MIYLWRIPDKYPQEMLGEYDRERSPDRFLFLRGVRVALERDEVPRVRFRGTSGSLAGYDVLPNNSGIPLVSSSVAKVLEQKWREDIQLIPTEVCTSSGPLLGYGLVNPVHLVMGVDESKSDFVYIPNTKQIMKFNSLELKPDCLGLRSVARLAEFPMFLLVADFVRREFDLHGWRGHWFVPSDAIKP